MSTPVAEQTTNIKCIIVGNTGVGKSRLMLKYTQQDFRMQHDPTIGVEFACKIIPCGEQKIKLYVWDTAGQSADPFGGRACWRKCFVLSQWCAKAIQNLEKVCTLAGKILFVGL